MIELLPYREEAYIPSGKIHSYLLSQIHTVGRSKAKFFRAIGFHEKNAEMLEEELLTIARTEAVRDIKDSPYGTKYVIRGTLHSSKGISVLVETVWIIEHDEQQPRLVTAYPSR